MAALDCFIASRPVLPPNHPLSSRARWAAALLGAPLLLRGLLLAAAALHGLLRAATLSWASGASLTGLGALLAVAGVLLLLLAASGRPDGRAQRRVGALLDALVSATP